MRNVSSRKTISIEDSIVIERPVEDILDFYWGFRNFPSFLGGVMRVEPVGE